MIKIKIVKNKEIIYESTGYYQFSSEKTIDWNDLSGADLSNADLRNADLSDADLSDADLRNADLFGAYLSGADLSDAYLRNAYLSGANLRYAYLSNAVLRNADLSNADLSNADLRNANLFGAYLSGADLSNADLRNADLEDTQLDEVEKCRKGMVLKRKIIGYKKCRNDIIVKLEIPRGAIVFSINNNKCRTNIAKVIDIDNNLSEVKSKFEENFIYKKGEIIEIDDFNLMYNIECASGIHFFRTRKEAVDYEL